MAGTERMSAEAYQRRFVHKGRAPARRRAPPPLGPLPTDGQQSQWVPCPDGQHAWAPVRRGWTCAACGIFLAQALRWVLPVTGPQEDIG